MIDLRAPDAFPTHCHTEVTHATPARAVTVQRASRDLDNHVGVRHASALFTAAYAAARALLEAALDDAAVEDPSIPREAWLVNFDISYREIPQDEIVSEALPHGEGWSSLPAALSAGHEVSLASAVRSTNAQDRVVATTAVLWHLRPA
jgi:hypothetical protein